MLVQLVSDARYANCAAVYIRSAILVLSLPWVCVMREVFKFPGMKI